MYYECYFLAEKVLIAHIEYNYLIHRNFYETTFLYYCLDSSDTFIFV